MSEFLLRYFAQNLALITVKHTRRMMTAMIFATANTNRSMTVQEALTHADAIISLTKES